MLRKFVLSITFLISIVCYSQNSNFKIELSYPLPIDNNFVGENYNGIIDVGLQFRFLELNTINIGGSLYAGYFKNSKEDRVQPVDMNAFSIQPRIFAELNIQSIPKLHPSIGLGYSFFVFKANNNPTLNPTISNKSINESGLNLNTGLTFDINEKISIHVQYDFVKISVDGDVPDIIYNTNINILKIGFGYRI